MSKLDELELGDLTFYRDGFYSGEYNQSLHLKKAKGEDIELPKIFLGIYSNINGRLERQGYVYFYLDKKAKKAYFIGMKVENEYRNLNIGSLLIASWIDLCMNNGYETLGLNYKQKKPFIIYLLKTYGFEVLDITEYNKRKDVITICRSEDESDNSKLLFFNDQKHEKRFTQMNVYKEDNYSIIHSKEGVIELDDIILPLQGIKKNHVDYELLDFLLAEERVTSTIGNHRR